MGNKRHVCEQQYDYDDILERDSEIKRLRNDLHRSDEKIDRQSKQLLKNKIDLYTLRNDFKSQENLKLEANISRKKVFSTDITYGIMRKCKTAEVIKPDKDLLENINNNTNDLHYNIQTINDT